MKDSINKVPSLNDIRIRKNYDKILLQKPSLKKKLKINGDLLETLLLVDGKRDIPDISKKLGAEDKKVQEIISSLNQENIINFDNKKSNFTFSEYIFKYPLDMVYLEPSLRCNFKCMHCYASSPKKINLGKEMNKQERRNLVKQLDEVGVMDVCFTGGEPLLSKKTWELSEILRNKGINVGYITNWSLLDKKSIEKLQKLKPSFVRVSFHSYKKDKFNKIAGVNQYENVLNNMVSLKEKGIVPSISCTLFNGFNDSYNEIKGFLKFFKKRGFDKRDIVFDEFVPDGCGKNKEKYVLDEVKTTNKIDKAFGEVFNYFPEQREAPLGDSYCGVGVSSLNIKPNGDITPCPALFSIKAGNLLERSLKGIWENADIFKYFRNKEYIKNSECESCPELKRCHGGCKAKSLIFYGKMNAPDPWMCAHLKNEKPKTPRKL